MLFDGAHAEEEEALGNRVEDDEQDGGGDGRRGRHAGARDDESEVGDGGVGEDLLAVALAAGQGGSGHEGEGAGQGNDAREHGPGEGRREAQHKVDAGLDHRGGVQQGGNGRRGDHGAAQPALEGKLRGFGERGEAEEGDGQHGGRGMHDHGLGQHGLDGQGADGLLHEQHGGEEADAAHHVHPQGAGRVALGFAGAVMADEEEGTQGGDFPEEEHPCEAVAEDEAVHRAKEQQQEEEKAGLLGFGEAEMILMLLHVAEAENAHDPADEGDHEHHDEGQRIRKECGGLMAFQHEEIEVDHTGQLAERETHGQPVAYIHGHVQDEHEQGEIEHGHQGLEGTVRRYGQHEAAVQG